MKREENFEVCLLERSSSLATVSILCSESCSENTSISKPSSPRQQNPNLAQKVIRTPRGRKEKAAKELKHLYRDDRNYNAYLICKKFSESRMEKAKEFKSVKQESLRATLSNDLDTSNSTTGSLLLVNVPSDITEETSNTFYTKVRKNPISYVSHCGGFECMYPFTCT